MDTKDLEHYSEFAIYLSREAGKILQKYWGKLSDIQQKKYAWDLVTEADKESEKVILDLIKKTFPSHAILSEEAGLHQINSTEYTWVVDPLDGTTNYTHQYPAVSISIALLHHEEPIIGIVHNPIYEELFHAAKEQGSFLNGKPIHVSTVSGLSQSLLATGFAYDRRETEENNYREFCHMTHHSQGVRRGGSAALDLAYVAAGRLDGFWERGLNPWDIAAGVILIEEAGGKVSSYRGNELLLSSGRILATNGIIHPLMIEELQKARNERPPFYFEDPTTSPL